MSPASDIATGELRSRWKRPTREHAARSQQVSGSNRSRARGLGESSGSGYRSAQLRPVEDSNPVVTPMVLLLVAPASLKKTLRESAVNTCPPL